MTREHTTDLRNVREGDDLTIETTHGEQFRVECTMKNTEQVDLRLGEVQYLIWQFEGQRFDAYCSINDGLRSSQDDPQFPQHKGLYDQDTGKEYGYITSLQIHAGVEA